MKRIFPYKNLEDFLINFRTKFTDNHYRNSLCLINETKDIHPQTLKYIKKKYIYHHTKYLIDKFIHKRKIKRFFKKMQKKQLRDNNDIMFSGEYLANEMVHKKNFDTNAKINILEIGSFEGISTCFYLDLFKNANVKAVDPFVDYNERTDDMPSIKENFIANTKEYGDRCKFFEMGSDEFFDLKKKEFPEETYDIVYIDGLHTAEQVFKDSSSTWECLNKNGIIVFDDYCWLEYTDNILSNVNYAVNHFYEKHKNDLEILFVDADFIVKRIN